MLDSSFKIRNKPLPIFNPVVKGFDEETQIYETLGDMFKIYLESSRVAVQNPFIHIVV